MDTAELLHAHPELGRRLTRIVAIGGAVGVPGNVDPGHEHAEFNVWIDSLAARDVLASGVPVTLVPLDATNDVPSTVFFSEALAATTTRARQQPSPGSSTSRIRQSGQAASISGTSSLQLRSHFRTCCAMCGRRWQSPPPAVRSSRLAEHRSRSPFAPIARSSSPSSSARCSTRQRSRSREPLCPRRSSSTARRADTEALGTRRPGRWRSTLSTAALEASRTSSGSVVPRYQTYGVRHRRIAG